MQFHTNYNDSLEEIFKKHGTLPDDKIEKLLELAIEVSHIDEHLDEITNGLNRLPSEFFIRDSDVMRDFDDLIDDCEDEVLKEKLKHIRNDFVSLEEEISSDIDVAKYEINEAIETLSDLQYVLK